MATSTQTIRRLTIEGKTTGVNEAAASLDALSRAQTKVTDTAQGMAVATDTSAKRQLSAAGAYDRLLKSVDDNYRSQSLLSKGQTTVDRALQQGAISAAEHANAMSLLTQKYAASSIAANENTKQLGLARHELINLSRQAQDVAVSLAGGQSPLTVLFQQGSQIGDVFATSQGTVSGFFKQVTSSVGSFLTVGRVAFGGVALAITGATVALNSYLDSQQKVQMSLVGAGRASGQSVSSINSVAQSGSSLTGFSATEARAFAAELASTGKIGRDNLEPLVKIGHDIATVFGIDAADAAKMLGKAFSDPATGADQLNQRLGFLDAAMQRQIQNLVAQNRLQDAQRVLQAGVASGVAGVGEAVSTTTKFWTALGNTASNTWDAIGAGLSRITGIGLKLGLDEQVAVAQARLDSFKKDLETAQQYAKSLGSGARGVDTGYDAAIAGVQKYSAEVDRLTAAMKQNSAATADAQERQMSFAQAGAIRNQLPEIDQLQKLRNEQELLVKTLIDVQVTGGPASDILKRIGLSYDELAKAVATANGNLSSFKSEFQSQSTSLKIANDALTAFSPGAKGEIARRQSLESTNGAKMDPGEKAALGQQAYDNAVKSVNVSLSEQARARALAATQSVQSAQLDIDMIGKTVGQQAELRANLQARQALEQQASQNRTGFDEAEYERLKKINEELGKRTQMAALAAVNDNVSFGRQTALLSPDDVSIAQQLKGVYPDVATALGSVEAAGLRTNAALSSVSSTMSSTLTTGFADVLDGTKSLGQGFSDMSKSIIRSMEEALIKAQIVAPLMRALQTVAGGLLGGGDLLGSAGLTYGTPGTANSNLFGPVAPTFASGGYTGAGTKYQPAGIVHAGEYVFSQASVGRIGLGNLDRLHRGYADGGPVLPVTNYSNDNRSAGAVTVNVHNAPAGTNATAQAKSDGNGGFNIDVMLDAAQAKNIANPGSATSQVLAQRGRLASR